MDVAVVGAGSWGTTLASLLAARNEIRLWTRDPAVAQEVRTDHRNSAYLPGFELHPRLTATTDLSEALAGAELVVLAVPSKYFRSVISDAAQLIEPSSAVISVAKGIEVGTGSRMTEVVLAECGHDPARVGALSGPNLAKEVLSGQPSFSVLAIPDDELAGRLRRVLTTSTFRVFTNRDVVGCEIGGAVKNVLAIAAGVADGLGFGWNTKAALITRGLTEMARLGIALGAQPITFLGLAGNGDLTATCASPQSRNRHVGEELGKGRTLDEIVEEMTMVAEGVSTTPAVMELASRHDVPMPITRQVDAILSGRLSAGDAVRRLMRYEPGSELEDLTP